MSTEHCLHEQDWGKVLELVQSHDKEIYGNGRPGLNKTVVELTVETKSLSTKVQDLSNNVSAMLKYVNETAGENRERENNQKRRLSGFQIAGIIVAALVAVFTIINSVKSYQRDIQVQKVENWMNLWDFSPITRGGKPMLDTTKFSIKEIDSVK